jgi:hypothetical protein
MKKYFTVFVLLLFLTFSLSFAQTEKVENKKGFFASIFESVRDFIIKIPKLIVPSPKEQPPKLDFNKSQDSIPNEQESTPKLDIEKSTNTIPNIKETSPKLDVEKSPNVIPNVQKPASGLDLEKKPNVIPNVETPALKLDLEKSPNAVPIGQKPAPALDNPKAQTEYPLKIISPNGGEKWEIGKTYTIKWQSKGLSNSLEIYLRDDRTGPSYKLIATGIPNYINSYNWTIPQDFWGKYTVGNSYKIQVREIGGKAGGSPGEGVFDESDNYFSIVNPFSSTQEPAPILDLEKSPNAIPIGQKPAPALDNPKAQTEYPLKIISPNGGEKWEKGKTYIIRWTTSTNSWHQTIPEYLFLYVINMDLPCGPKSCPQNVFVQQVPTYKGAYSWFIPLDLVPGNKFTVGLEDGHYVYAKSEYFSILGTTSTQTSTSPYVHVRMPNGGEVLYTGKNYQVSWDFKWSPQMNVEPGAIVRWAAFDRNTKQFLYSGYICSQAMRRSPNLETYSCTWTVPTNETNLGSKEYKIWIEVITQTFPQGTPDYIEDYSDAPFFIKNMSISPVQPEPRME